MKRRSFHIGPGAASLLLVAVVVSMAILGLLAMMNVRSDVKLTERSTAAITAQYDASAQAERELATLDAAVTSVLPAADTEAFLTALADALPETMSLNDDIVSWDVTISETSVLHCAVQVSQSHGPDRLAWVRHQVENSIGSDMMD